MTRSKPLILTSLLLASFAINLDTTIVNVALPSLVRELHASTSQLQWIVDAYSLVFAALLLAAGSLSDRVGRKGVLLAGLAVFGLGSLAGGFTDSPGQLIVAPIHGWSSARSVTGFVLALTLFAVFVAWERRTDEPLIDLGLFRNLRFTAASASVTVVFFSLAGFIFLITQYFQFFKGYSPLSTGVHLLPVATSVGIMSVLGTRLAVRFSTKLVVTGGLVALPGCFAGV